MKQLKGAKARQFQAYNRWRAGHRELDRARRLERMATKTLPVPFQPSHAKAKRTCAFARVRIHFADGTSNGFSIHLGPFGLLPSATTAALALRRLLNAKA